jgi:hypothetical protein
MYLKMKMKRFCLTFFYSISHFVFLLCSTLTMTATRTPRTPFGDVSNLQLSKKLEKAKKKAVIDGAASWFLRVEKENNNKIPYGYADRICKANNVDRDALNYEVRKRKKAKEKTAETTPVTVDEDTGQQDNEENEEMEEDEHAEPTPEPRKGGRPKGSTDEAKKDKKERLAQAHSYAATQKWQRRVSCLKAPSNSQRRSLMSPSLMQWPSAGGTHSTAPSSATQTS